jgi:hypothetical protein
MLINNNFILFFDVVNDKSTLLLNFEPVTQLLSVAKKQNSSNEMLLTWSDENNHVLPIPASRRKAGTKP